MGVRASKHTVMNEDVIGSVLRRGLRATGARSKALSNATDNERRLQIKRCLHIGRFPIMWKEKWIGPANLDRANLRIAGMETYAVVAAVLLQTILGLYGAVAEPQDDDPRIVYPKLQRIAYELQMILLMIAVVCSTYTMVMYLVVKIYTVTALGMWKDVAYEVFTASTARCRSHAFWTLIISIITFLLAFALDLYSKVKGIRGIALTLIAMAGITMLVRDGAEVLLNADEHVFGN